MLETNRIYNMDCLEGIKKIETGSVKLVATDPPYFQGFTHNGQKGAFNDLAISRPFFAQLAQEFARILSEDGEFYIFAIGADMRFITRYLQTIYLCEI